MQTVLAMTRTHRWLKQSVEEHQRDPHSAYGFRQALFGIIQGGEFRDLREESLEFIVNMPLDGIAIGGAVIALVFLVPIFQWLLLGVRSEIQSYLLLIPVISVYLVWSRKEETPWEAGVSMSACLAWGTFGVISGLLYLASHARGLILPQADALTFAQAQKQSLALQDQAKRDGGIITRPATVAEAAEKYLAWFREHRKSVTETEHTVRVHILPTLGERRIADLKAPALRKWRR